MSLAERAARERAARARRRRPSSACRKCAIGSTRRNSVYGEGDPVRQLMVVGEGPGETEDRLGRPFVGRAGELLEKMLAAIDLPREDVYICNTVKCRPTLDEGDAAAQPRADARRDGELPAVSRRADRDHAPRVILALGAPAAKTFLGRNSRSRSSAAVVRRARAASR